MQSVISIIHFLIQAVSLAIVIYVVLTLVLPVTNPIRMALARVIEPWLNPIRKYVKPFYGVDFSPVILLVIFNLVEFLLTGILSLFVH